MFFITEGGWYLSPSNLSCHFIVIENGTKQPCLKGPITQDNVPRILPLNFDASLQSCTKRHSVHDARKLNMSPGDVYLSHKRREKWTWLYNVRIAAWCNENVATHGSFVGGVTSGRFLSLNTTNRNPPLREQTRWHVLAFVRNWPRNLDLWWVNAFTS